MKFRDRLEHLGAPTQPAGAERAASSPRTPEATDLESLRERMAAIMGRAPAPPEPPRHHDAALSSLPFCEVERAEGRLCQRLEPQRRSAHVGRLGLDEARGADPGLLSLLALDPQLSECDFGRALYFDTETTGLGGAGTLAFLVGLAWFDEQGALHLEQLLLRNPAEEVALLARFEELLARSSVLVSFNGKSFDWPLLQGRRVMNRLEELPTPPHLDLLHLARRLHKRRLARVRLIDLEAEVLGWQRGEDDIPGAEIAPRYGHFLRTGDEEALRAVIDHNAWDVLSMVALVGLYGERLGRDDALGLEHADDWLGMATTLGRAKAWEGAERATSQAIAGGVGSDGLRFSARLHQARGDKARALDELTELHARDDDDATRLALCKLLEHYRKDFEAALALVDRGTGEDAEAWVRRRQRLVRKARKSGGR